MHDGIACSPLVLLYFFFNFYKVNKTQFTRNDRGLHGIFILFPICSLFLIPCMMTYSFRFTATLHIHMRAWALSSRNW